MTRVQSDACELLPGAVYLSPTGRACRLAAEQGNLHRAAWAHLVYDTAQGRPARGSMADGFTLSRANWALLRRLA